MALPEAGRLTVSGGQFDWGGHLKYGAHRQQCLVEASGYMLGPPFSTASMTPVAAFELEGM